MGFRAAAVGATDKELGGTAIGGRGWAGIWTAERYLRRRRRWRRPNIFARRRPLAQRIDIKAVPVKSRHGELELAHRPILPQASRCAPSHLQIGVVTSVVAPVLDFMAHGHITIRECSSFGAPPDTTSNLSKVPIRRCLLQISRPLQST